MPFGTLRIAAKRYAPFQMTFKLILGISLLSFNFCFGQQSTDSLYIKGSIGGMVGFDFYPVVDQAEVTLENIPATIYADSSGNFLFSRLKPSSYKIHISAWGYDKKDTLVSLINRPIDSLRIILISNCMQNGRTAHEDIISGKPKLLLQGGISPIIYKGQEKFERKYKIKYSDFGCTGQPTGCSVEYNLTIFKYLDNKFGKGWRKEVRQDIIGLK